jgi:HlyD family secretion protein
MTNNHGKTLPLVIGITALLAFLATGVWLAFRPKPVVVEGRIEATEFNVSAKITGRVDTLPIRIGDRVEKGRTLATLESPELNAKLAQAKAALEGARAQQKKALTGARRQEIENSRQQWIRAEDAAKLAATTLERITKLHDEGVLPQQRLDEVATQARAAQSSAAGAKALFDLISEGTRVEDREASAALEQQAAAVVEEVAALQKEAIVVAPQSGEVRSIQIERGELAPAGFPLVTLVDLDDIWAVAQVREDLMKNLKMGDRFKARVPALADLEITLSVFFISPMGDFATWRATKQSAGFDLRTFEVRARPIAPVEGLRPGMSVVVSGRVFQN